MEGASVSSTQSPSAEFNNNQDINQQWDDELSAVDNKGDLLNDPKVRKVVENFIGNMTIEMIKQNMKPQKIDGLDG